MALILVGLFWVIAGLSNAAPVQAEQARCCAEPGVWLQVLGSGGPELIDGRASSGYLVWIEGKARVMVDTGSGSALRFFSSGADFADLDAVLFTHLHVDHSADLPALIKASYFGDRRRDLLLLGPTGNYLMPSLNELIFRLFGQEGGSWRYLSEYLDPAQPSAYKLVASSIPAGGKEIRTGFENRRLRARAVPVHHGPIPALAWRVEAAGKALVFSGDMSGRNGTLEGLAAGADLLVAHNAVPEGAQGAARSLHMPPSEIGRIAAAAKVGRLVLSHRMARTLGREDETVRAIRRFYKAPVAFAEDLECFEVGK
jgi:ribonuclease BN (tRNA processing enzyme)